MQASSSGYEWSRTGWGGQDAHGAGSRRVGVPESAGTLNRQRGVRVHSRESQPFRAPAGPLREHSFPHGLQPRSVGSEAAAASRSRQVRLDPCLLPWRQRRSDSRVCLSLNATRDGTLKDLGADLGPACDHTAPSHGPSRDVLTVGVNTCKGARSGELGGCSLGLLLSPTPATCPPAARSQTERKPLQLEYNLLFNENNLCK